MLKINSKYRQLDVSWKDMEDTEYYTLEYRELGSNSEFIVVNDININTYTITGLKDDTSYEVYVSGWNTDDNGNPRHGPRSLPAVGKTINEIPKFQKYKMINNDIKDIKLIYGLGGTSDFNPRDLVDGDYSTYFFKELGSTFWG
ncbi:MAG: fibronectin type III domain-containing protein [Thomasclavelia sp.]